MGAAEIEQIFGIWNMKFLLDTHLLLWAAGEPGKLPGPVRTLIQDASNDLHFSPINIWEIAIKQSLGRSDFHANARQLRRGLLDKHLS